MVIIVEVPKQRVFGEIKNEPWWQIDKLYEAQDGVV